MMKYVIEIDVPVPTQNRGRQRKYPLLELSVGQSFWVPAADATSESVRNSAANVSRRYKDRKFSTRSEGEGTRVWRIE